MVTENGSWDEYQKLIIAELNRFDRELKEIKSSQIKILSEIEILKVKAGVWGAMGGLVTGIGAAILYLLGLSGKH